MPRPTIGSLVKKAAPGRTALSLSYPIWMVLMFTTCVFGNTSVVAVKTKSEIIIAADSKLNPGVGYVPVTPISAAVCKIRQFGDVFVALAGFSGFLDGTSNPADVAAVAFRTQGRLSARVYGFEGAMEAMLAESLLYVNPSDYGRHKVESIIAGIEGNQLVMYLRVFQLSSDGSNRFTTIGGDCPWDFCVFHIGEFGAVRSFLSSHPTYLSDATSLPSAVRDLVKMQAEATPEKVGGEIDILRITKTDAKWIQKKAECPEVEAIARPKPRLATKQRRKGRKARHR